MVDFSSICLYLSLLISSSIFVFISQKKNNFFFLIFPLAFLTIVSGFRAYTVGNDTLEYCETFVRLKNGDYEIFHFEKSFLYISGFLLRFFSVRFLFVFYSFITYLFILLRIWDFRKNTNLVIVFLAFFVEVFFFTITGLRQSIAFSIVFWATRYIKKRHYIVFLIFVIIASLFHQSALISFIYIFVELFEITGKFQNIILYYISIYIFLYELIRKKGGAYFSNA